MFEIQLLIEHEDMSLLITDGFYPLYFDAELFTCFMLHCILLTIFSWMTMALLTIFYLPFIIQKLIKKLLNRKGEVYVKQRALQTINVLVCPLLRAG